MKEISIKAPKFEQYQSVILYWNDKEYKTVIVKRWFDLDDGCWLYEVKGGKQKYSEDYLDPLIE